MLITRILASIFVLIITVIIGILTYVHPIAAIIISEMMISIASGLIMGKIMRGKL